MMKNRGISNDDEQAEESKEKANVYDVDDIQTFDDNDEA